jgi:hypothetical protein
MMISRDYLVQEFVHLVGNYYPEAGKVLDFCYVKVLECYLERSGRQFYYLGIYYPQERRRELQAQQQAFKDIAENMGLIEVVSINATRLVRDPMSKLKKDNPKFWLELYWIATQHHFLTH